MYSGELTSSIIGTREQRATMIPENRYKLLRS